MATNLVPKSSEKYFCEICDFNCSRKSQYDRHLMTRKHQMATNSNHLVHISSDITPYICNNCSKHYKDRSGLWRHQKKCFINEDIIQHNSNNLNTCSDIDKELLVKMLLKNSDVMEKMLEIMPQLGNTTNNNNNNNTNSHNTNTFNINMFLNEHCKNAMNLTDFIQSLPITNKTYDETIHNGLTNTITNMMVNGLNELDILERPIHCTDTKRKTLYVKEADIWEKDDELNKILQGIKGIALKQRTMINKWQDVNTGWDRDDDLQTKLTKLVFNSMTSIEEDDKETCKIIRAISKNVYLDNDTKKSFLN